MIREARSTEDIARFVVELTTDGVFRTSFTQGEFQTEPVETTGLNPSRVSKTLPWDQTWKRVEYGIGLTGAKRKHPCRGYESSPL